MAPARKKSSAKKKSVRRSSPMPMPIMMPAPQPKRKNNMMWVLLALLVLGGLVMLFTTDAGKQLRDKAGMTGTAMATTQAAATGAPGGIVPAFMAGSGPGGLSTGAIVGIVMAVIVAAMMTTGGAAAAGYGPAKGYKEDIRGAPGAIRGYDYGKKFGEVRGGASEFGGKAYGAGKSGLARARHAVKPVGDRPRKAAFSRVEAF